MRKEDNEKKRGGELLLLLGIFILWAVLVTFLSIGDAIIAFLFIFPLLDVFVKKGLKPIWVGRIILLFFILNVFYYVSLTIDRFYDVDTSDKPTTLITSTLIQNFIEFGIITEEDEKGLNEVIKRLVIFTDFEGDIMIKELSSDYAGGPKRIIRTDLNKLTIEEKTDIIVDNYAMNGLAFGLLLCFVFVFVEGKIQTSSGERHFLEDRKILNVILYICSITVYCYTIYVLNPAFNFY